MDKRTVLEKHFKKISTKDNQTRLKHIKFKGNGDMQFGTAERMVWAKEVVEESGHDYYKPELAEGSQYPDVDRLFPSYDYKPIELPVKDFQNVLSPLLSKVGVLYQNRKQEWKTRYVPISEFVEITINASGIVVTPVYKNDHFVKASIDYDTGAEEEIQFRINTKFLVEALMLFKQLKHKEVFLTFRAPLRAILLHAEGLD